eukprot:gene7545-8016_t
MGGLTKSEKLEPWYAGAMTRTEAEQALAGTPNGLDTSVALRKPKKWFMGSTLPAWLGGSGNEPPPPPEVRHMAVFMRSAGGGKNKTKRLYSLAQNERRKWWSMEQLVDFYGSDSLERNFVGMKANLSLPYKHAGPARRKQRGVVLHAADVVDGCIVHGCRRVGNGLHWAGRQPLGAVPPLAPHYCRPWRGPPVRWYYSTAAPAAWRGPPDGWYYSTAAPAAWRGPPDGWYYSTAPPAAWRSPPDGWYYSTAPPAAWRSPPDGWYYSTVPPAAWGRGALSSAANFDYSGSEGTSDDESAFDRPQHVNYKTGGATC